MNLVSWKGIYFLIGAVLAAASIVQLPDISPELIIVAAVFTSAAAVLSIIE